MERILAYVQIGLAVLLVASILLQSKGTALGGAFGGGDSNVYRTKRGAEKVLFVGTIVLAILFFGAAFASLVARQ